MKRIICMLLVLVLCMYLPCTAFAVSSPGQSGSAPTVPSTDNPKTGDSFAMYTWIIVMVLALLALVAVVIFYRKAMKK